MAPSKVVLITGANSGVGLASAEVIASASPEYHVIMASRNPSNGEAALAELKAKDSIKGTLSAIQLDVTDQASIAAAAKEVEEQFGKLDVLVNNAGIVDFNPDTKTSLINTWTTNTLGPALVFEAFKDLLLRSGNAYSVYISSGLGSIELSTNPAYMGYDLAAAPYRTSKAALNMWAVVEHKLYGSKGIKTFTMCPGYVVSNLRGKSEEARNGGGLATSPLVSGQTLLGIMEGKRDQDVGKFVHEKGVYPW